MLLRIIYFCFPKVDLKLSSKTVNLKFIITNKKKNIYCNLMYLPKH